MEPSVKPNSIRCDMHPPLSAIMYCDGCKTFLCRICAEVKPGGRVCATCKQPCREPSPEEFLKLVTERKRDQEAASAVKYLEAKQKENAEKAKIERDARLKAEFAARKATLGQAKPVEVNAAPITNTSSTAPSSNGGTMYDPGQKTQTVEVEDDPLAHLAERSYLNVIDRARVIMMIVSICTLIFSVAQYFILNDEERVFQNELAVQHEEDRQNLQRLIAQTKDKVDKRKLEQELKEDTFGTMKQAVAGTGFAIARMFIGCYVVAAILLIILRHTSEDTPRGSTIAAFIIFMLVNLLDLAIFGIGNRYIFALRWAALVALYKAMNVGIALHKMRVEKAAEKAAAMASRR
ncbi:MAG: B-box zinc finger protein [Planctomycetota bacterium]